MAKHDIVIIADYSKDQPLTLEELCEICHISADFIQDLVEYEIISPKGKEQDEWAFDLEELERIKTALRLQRDLEVNLSGIALALDLMEQLEELRAEMELIKKHYL